MIFRVGMMAQDELPYFIHPVLWDIHHQQDMPRFQIIVEILQVNVRGTGTNKQPRYPDTEYRSNQEQYQHESRLDIHPDEIPAKIEYQADQDAGQDTTDKTDLDTVPQVGFLGSRFRQIPEIGTAFTKKMYLFFTNFREQKIILNLARYINIGEYKV